MNYFKVSFGITVTVIVAETLLCCIFFSGILPQSAAAPATISYSNVCFTPKSAGVPYDPAYSPYLIVPPSALPLTICSITFM